MHWLKETEIFNFCIKKFIEHRQKLTINVNYFFEFLVFLSIQCFFLFLTFTTSK